MTTASASYPCILSTVAHRQFVNGLGTPFVQQLGPTFTGQRAKLGASALNRNRTGKLGARVPAFKAELIVSLLPREECEGRRGLLRGIIGMSHVLQGNPPTDLNIRLGWIFDRI
jgi:hypothetical protein